MFSVITRQKNVECQDETHSPGRSMRSYKYPKLACVFPNSEAFRTSISYTGPKYWEKLPGRLKIISELRSFKQELKIHFKDLFIESGFV